MGGIVIFKKEYAQYDDVCDKCYTYILELVSISSKDNSTINYSISGTLCVLNVDY